MMLSETLPDMTKHITLRQLAGSIVRDKMARDHLSRVKAADMADMAPSTLDRVIKGEDETVTDITLRKIEGGIGLPIRLLTLVIEGDDQKLGRLEMDAVLRDHVVSSVIDIKNGSPADEKPRKRGRGEKS